MNEWFGPVLGIMKAPNLKKAIEWQNAPDYGLNGRSPLFIHKRM